jgi:hypothetical protein
MRPAESPEMAPLPSSMLHFEAAFGAKHGPIVDVSGKCLGFVAVPSFRDVVIQRTGAGDRMRHHRVRVASKIWGGRE